MFGIGTGELIVILVVVVLLFGARRIPEVARALGRAVREFKKARDDLEREVDAPASVDKAKAQDDAEKPIAS